MTQRASADIAAELTEFRAARRAKVMGERVTDVWRDGRRMRLSDMSLKELEDAIASLEREYDAALADEAGTQRRRPIGLAWRN